MTQDAIIRAIAARKLIDFTYHGCHRVVEPHDLGVRHNVTQLLGYQVRGDSESGGIPEWRRFDVREIRGLVVTRQTFPAPRRAWVEQKPEWDRRIAAL